MANKSRTWKYHRYSIGMKIESSKPPFTIATVHGDTDAQQEEFARILAAAPDMLAALEEAQKCLSMLMKKIDWGKTYDINFALLNSALLKVDEAVFFGTGKPIKPKID